MEIQEGVLDIKKKMVLSLFLLSPWFVLVVVAFLSSQEDLLFIEETNLMFVKCSE